VREPAQTGTHASGWAGEGRATRPRYSLPALAHHPTRSPRARPPPKAAASKGQQHCAAAGGTALLVRDTEFTTAHANRSADRDSIPGDAMSRLLRRHYSPGPSTRPPRGGLALGERVVRGRRPTSTGQAHCAAAGGTSFARPRRAHKSQRRPCSSTPARPKQGRPPRRPRRSAKNTAPPQAAPHCSSETRNARPRMQIEAQAATTHP
jgi:hypothetical protein